MYETMINIFIWTPVLYLVYIAYVLGGTAFRGFVKSEKVEMGKIKFFSIVRAPVSYNGRDMGNVVG